MLHVKHAEVGGVVLENVTFHRCVVFISSLSDALPNQHGLTFAYVNEFGAAVVSHRGTLQIRSTQRNHFEKTVKPEYEIVDQPLTDEDVEFVVRFLELRQIKSKLFRSVQNEMKLEHSVVRAVSKRQVGVLFWVLPRDVVGKVFQLM